MNRHEIEERLIAEQPRLFHAYWWRLKDGLGDQVPSRTDFDPSAVKSVLPFILFHDLSEPRKSILRLVGTAMSTRYGFDPTGRDYLEFVSENRKDVAYRELIKTATHPCGMRIIVEVLYQSGKRTVGESLGYPFLKSDGSPMMMFCDQLIEKPAHDLDARSTPMEIHAIRERDYVDIGFGIPERDA